MEPIKFISLLYSFNGFNVSSWGNSLISLTVLLHLYSVHTFLFFFSFFWNLYIHFIVTLYYSLYFTCELLELTLLDCVTPFRFKITFSILYIRVYIHTNTHLCLFSTNIYFMFIRKHKYLFSIYVYSILYICMRVSPSLSLFSIIDLNHRRNTPLLL